jgi:starch phosphorylase
MVSLSPQALEHDRRGAHRRAARHAVPHRLVFSLGKDPETATPRDWFHATALAVRDRLIERWMDGMRTSRQGATKQVYYLSMEFLTGRLLSNSLLNLGVDAEFRAGLADRRHPDR